MKAEPSKRFLNQLAEKLELVLLYLRIITRYLLLY